MPAPAVSLFACPWKPTNKGKLPSKQTTSPERPTQGGRGGKVGVWFPSFLGRGCLFVSVAPATEDAVPAGLPGRHDGHWLPGAAEGRALPGGRAVMGGGWVG